MAPWRRLSPIWIQAHLCLWMLLHSLKIASVIAYPSPSSLWALRPYWWNLWHLKHFTWLRSFFPWFEDLESSFFFWAFLDPSFFPPFVTFPMRVSSWAFSKLVETISNLFSSPTKLSYSFSKVWTSHKHKYTTKSDAKMDQTISFSSMLSPMVADWSLNSVIFMI